MNKYLPLQQCSTPHDKSHYKSLMPNKKGSQMPLYIRNYYDLTETFYKTHFGELYISFELVPLFHILYGLVFIIYNPLKVVKGLFCLPYLTDERDLCEVT